MIKYANFFPGSMRDERSLTIDDQAGYAVVDLQGFILAVIDGTTASMLVPVADDPENSDDVVGMVCLPGMIHALEDGALLAYWFGGHDSEDETEEQRAQREAVEEVHDLLTRYNEQRGLTITLSTSRDYLGPQADEADYVEFEGKAIAALMRAWPYARICTDEQYRLVRADHERVAYADSVAAEAQQLLEKI